MVQVTFIARGDVPLSVIMTLVSTLLAALATPLLTQLLIGAIVPVDLLGLARSTLQVQCPQYCTVLCFSVMQGIVLYCIVTRHRHLVLVIPSLCHSNRAVSQCP